MKILYFAWLRERIGRPEEELALPAHVETIADLMTHLIGLGEEYAHAFERADLIRAAINRKHVPHESRIDGASEIAFFPPVTGG
jgi:sulfur-carrier protein